jgi:hypothetical protein
MFFVKRFIENLLAPVTGFDIFISYSLQDGKLLAKELNRVLTEKKFRCFLDQEHVQGGDALTPKISRALKKSTLLVVLLTEKATQSSWVQKEVTTYQQSRKNARFFPIAVSPTDINKLPAHFHFLSDFSGSSSIKEIEELTDVSEIIDKSFQARKVRSKNFILSSLIFLILAFSITAYSIFENRRNSAEVWKGLAKSYMAELRYDKAEMAFARSNNYAVLEDPELKQLYHESRSKRFVTFEGSYPLSEKMRVIAVGEQSGRWQVLLSNTDTNEISIFNGRDSTFICQCPSSARVVLQHHDSFIIGCYQKLMKISFNNPSLKKELELPDTIIEGTTGEVTVKLLTRSGMQTRYSEIDKETFNSVASYPLDLDINHLVLSNHKDDSFWNVKTSDGFFILQRYNADATAGKSYQFYIPDPAGVSQITSAYISKTISYNGNLYINYSPNLFSFGSSLPSSGWVKIETEDYLIGIQLIATEICRNRLFPTDRKFGSDCIFLQPNKDLKEVPFRIPVTDQTPRVLLNNVEDAVLFEHTSEQKNIRTILATDRTYLYVVEGSEVKVKYPLIIDGQTLLRLYHSVNDAVLVVEGDNGFVVWRLNEQQYSTRVPTPDELRNELKMSWIGDSIIYLTESEPFRTPISIKVK